MILLSASRTSVAKSCWKKYQWKYIEGLRPVTKPISLTLGSIIHDAFESFYKGESDANVYHNIGKAFDKEMSKVSLPDHEALIVAKYTALGMWKFNPYKLDTYEEIHPEVEFSVTVGNLRGVRLIGRMDGKVKKAGTWWVREVKTSGMYHQAFRNMISVSAQATAYVYAMQRMGYKVDGVVYDAIRKPRLQKRQHETAHDFGKRIWEDYRDRPTAYFMREFTYRNPTHMKLFENDTIQLVRDMRARKRSNIWYRNTDNCYKYNSECAYKKICFQEKPDTLTLQLFYTREPMVLATKRRGSK